MLLIAGVAATQDRPWARPQEQDGHRRELRRADRPGQRTHHRAVRGRREPERRGRTAADRCGSPTRPTAPSRGSTASRGDDAVTIPVGGSARRARVRRRLAVGRRQRLAHGGAGRPGREQGRAARIDGRQRAARAGRRRRARCGSRRASTGAIRGIDLDSGRRGAADPGRREPERDRGGRRRAVGGERGGGHGDADRARGPGSVVPRDPGRQRAERARGRRGRGLGRQPPRRHARRGSTPRRTRSSWARRRRPRPDRGRRRARASVWVGGRRGGDRRRVDPDGPRSGRAARDREQPGGDRGRRRIGVGRRATPRWPRTAAGRCACGIPYAAGMGDPDRLAALAGLHHVGDLAAQLAGL